jgi:LuxR family maltose regulon positive regulatory protein
MNVYGRTMIPKLSRRIIPRERLLARLHRAIGGQVMVIEAPAGFGKTTLLAQFAADLDFTPVWLTLDSTSGSPEVLAHQIGIALSGRGDAEPPATSSKFSDLQAYVGAELARTAARCELPLLLLFDNIHELVEERDRREARSASPVASGPSSQRLTRASQRATSF